LICVFVNCDIQTGAKEEHLQMAYEFDPDRVAYFESAGWRAYYEHAWFKMLSLLVRLNQEQFHIPFPVSLLAVYYVVRASAAWVPKDHDCTKVSAWLEKFYRLARRYSGLLFNPARVAVLEEQYWEVHRRLSGKPDKAEFVQTMIELHSEIFGILPEQARSSAELRVSANNHVDLITSQTSTDPESDWAKLEEELRQCYRSIQIERKGISLLKPI
jgi:hypothetical protein